MAKLMGAATGGGSPLDTAANLKLASLMMASLVGAPLLAPPPPLCGAHDCSLPGHIDLRLWRVPRHALRLLTHQQIDCGWLGEGKGGGRGGAPNATAAAKSCREGGAHGCI